MLFGESADGGASWGSERFVCGLACTGVGWQYDPQIKVAADTNPACGCGTIYVVFLNTFDRAEDAGRVKSRDIVPAGCSAAPGI